MSAFPKQDKHRGCVSYTHREQVFGGNDSPRAPPTRACAPWKSISQALSLSGRSRHYHRSFCRRNDVIRRTNFLRSGLRGWNLNSEALFVFRFSVPIYKDAGESFPRRPDRNCRGRETYSSYPAREHSSDSCPAPKYKREEALRPLPFQNP